MDHKHPLGYASTSPIASTAFVMACFISGGIVPVRTRFCSDSSAIAFASRCQAARGRDLLCCLVFEPGSLARMGTTLY